MKRKYQLPIRFSNEKEFLPASDIFDDFFTRAERSLTEMFNSFFDNNTPFSTMVVKSAYPKLNIEEDENGITIEATVTGLDKKDIVVKMEDNGLVIKYEKASKEKKEGSKQIVREFSKSSFCRIIPIDPDMFKVDLIKAEMKNGLLTIKIPFKEKQDHKKEKFIEIE